MNNANDAAFRKRLRMLPRTGAGVHSPTYILFQRLPHRQADFTFAIAFDNNKSINEVNLPPLNPSICTYHVPKLPVKTIFTKQRR